MENTYYSVKNGDAYYHEPPLDSPQLTFASNFDTNIFGNVDLFYFSHKKSNWNIYYSSGKVFFVRKLVKLNLQFYKEVSKNLLKFSTRLILLKCIRLKVNHILHVILK